MRNYLHQDDISIGLYGWYIEEAKVAGRELDFTKAIK